MGRFRPDDSKQEDIASIPIAINPRAMSGDSLEEDQDTRDEEEEEELDFGGMLASRTLIDGPASQIHTQMRRSMRNAAARRTNMQSHTMAMNPSLMPTVVPATLHGGQQASLGTVARDFGPQIRRRANSINDSYFQQFLDDPSSHSLHHFIFLIVAVVVLATATLCLHQFARDAAFLDNRVSLPVGCVSGFAGQHSISFLVNFSDVGMEMDTGSAWSDLPLLHFGFPPRCSHLVPHSKWYF